MHEENMHSIQRINYLSAEIESLYHQCSIKLGIADSVSRVLYMMYDTGENCLLSDIYKRTGISKQTINSAIRSLEASGVLYLVPYTGRTKRVVLTEKGKEYMAKTAARVYQAEINVFDAWSKEEVNTYIHLTEKYKECFRQQIELL